MADHRKDFRTGEDYRDHLPCEVCEPTGSVNWDGIAQLTYAAYCRKLICAGFTDAQSKGSWMSLTQMERDAWIEAAKECVDIFVKAVTA